MCLCLLGAHVLRMFVKGESQLLLSLLDNGNDEINKEHMHVENLCCYVMSNTTCLQIIWPHTNSCTEIFKDNLKFLCKKSIVTCVLIE